MIEDVIVVVVKITLVFRLSSFVFRLSSFVYNADLV